MNLRLLRGVFSGLIADLAGYVRGSIIRGGVAGWEVYTAKTAGQILVGDGADIRSVAVDGDATLIGVLDTRYLKLDASNDPVTAGLEINALTAAEPVLILQTTDDNATNPILEIQNAAGAMLSEIEKDGNLNFTTTLAANPGIIKINDTRFFHTYGTASLFIGLGAGNFTFTGNNNIAIGDGTGAALTTGTNNVFIGRWAGDAVKAGVSNFCLGTAAGSALIGGSWNVFIGTIAGLNATSASNNVGLGEASLQNLTTGIGNVGVGSNTLVALTTTAFNVAIGVNAMENAAGADAEYNVAIGYKSGRDLTQLGNTLIGCQTAMIATSARGNVCIGYQTGDIITTGDYNILIGYNIDPTGAAISNELNIGALIYGKLDTKRGGVNVTPPNLLATWHVDQPVDSAAIPVLILDQADISEGFVNFVGSDRGVITGATNSVGSVRAEINGTVYRLALYTDA